MSVVRFEMNICGWSSAGNKLHSLESTFSHFYTKQKWNKKMYFSFSIMILQGWINPKVLSASAPKSTWNDETSWIRKPFYQNKAAEKSCISRYFCSLSLVLPLIQSVIFCLLLHDSKPGSLCGKELQNIHLHPPGRIQSRPEKSSNSWHRGRFSALKLWSYKVPFQSTKPLASINYYQAPLKINPTSLASLSEQAKAFWLKSSPKNVMSKTGIQQLNISSQSMRHLAEL